MSLKYRTLGHTVIKNIFTPECIRLLAGEFQEIRTMDEKVDSLWHHNYKHNSRFPHLNDIPKHLKQYVTDLVCTERKDDDSPALQPVQEAKKVIHWETILLRKDGNKENPVGWHQDSSSFTALCPQRDARVVTCWIPLQTTEELMGTVQFANGTHLTQEIKSKDKWMGYHQKPTTRMARRFTSIETEEKIDAGSVEFHDGFTFHYSKRNATNKVRDAIVVSLWVNDFQVRNEINEMDTYVNKRGRQVRQYTYALHPYSSYRDRLLPGSDLTANTSFIYFDTDTSIYHVTDGS
jgi:ectoine hydroxylase-related dioxygenase (phytanoyl-CoA dioxygenase family)